ncbi:hypothetical protein HDU79_012073 [Rhizoclosmatium sp. JEL0117]|nr:hypothetical protein HDU79_012073 [Rhizoclosmatium sp. JEL0117]
MDACWFEFKYEATGECYSVCKECLREVKESDKKRKQLWKTSITAWLRAMSHSIIGRDKEASGGKVCLTIEQALEIVGGAYDRLMAQDDGCKCLYCKEGPLICLGSKGEIGASIERRFGNLLYSDSRQVVEFICKKCNWAKQSFSRREFRQFLRDIANAPEEWSHIPLIAADEVYIKQRRKNTYSTEDRKMSKRSQNVKKPCEFVGTTATSDEMVVIARKMGKMDTVAHLIGEWSISESIRKLGFNRLKSYEGDRYKPSRRYAHSKNNIEVRLTSLNLAENHFGREGLKRWIDAVKIACQGDAVVLVELEDEYDSGEENSNIECNDHADMDEDL